MKYTIENYEEFALDYLEGNLNEEEMAEFKVFLLLHPEIHETLIQFDWVTLEADESIFFPDKNRLLKENNPSRFLSINSRRLLAVAAVMAFLITTWVLVVDDQNNTNQVEVVTLPEGVKQEESDLAASAKSEDLAAVQEKSKAHSGGSMGESTSVEETIRLDPVKVQSSKVRKPETVEEADLVHIAPSDHESDVTKPQIRHSRIIFEVTYLETRDIAHVELPYPLENLALPEIILPDEDWEREPGKLKKFLAKVNLVPFGLEDLEDVAIKDKLIPETFSGPK